MLIVVNPAPLWQDFCTLATLASLDNSQAFGALLLNIGLTKTEYEERQLCILHHMQISFQLFLASGFCSQTLLEIEYEEDAFPFWWEWVLFPHHSICMSCGWQSL